ncbi:ribosome-recycling factor [Streptomyces sp. NPDC032472]|uniref:ribosome-recycling factor n=1 Tax=Streptomyces sp. NPDC032472 TaxID=3155018 RepID=UPI0033F0510A
MSNEVLLEGEKNMTEALAAAQRAFASIRIGQASPGMLDGVRADYRGATIPVSQLAAITAPDARTHVLEASDTDAARAIEKAIRDADLGLNPAVDGKTLRMSVPALTEERRKQMTQMAETTAEKSRASLRDARDDAADALDQLTQDGKLSEDEILRTKTQLDQALQQNIAKVEELLGQKKAALT